jgi:hypothetical protein
MAGVPNFNSLFRLNGKVALITGGILHPEHSCLLAFARPYQRLIANTPSPQALLE